MVARLIAAQLTTITVALLVLTGTLGTGRAPRIEGQAMTQAEVKAYYAGYEHNEQHGDKKSWD